MMTGSKILIVDDDPMMRMLSREALRTAGFEIEEASDGITALENVARALPDLVLLDVTMPGYDGFTVCKMLRERAESAFLPIIMLTSLDDGESINSAYDAGATDFILKPINWKILVQRVRSVLRAARAFGDLRVSQTRLEHAQRIAQLGHWEWDLDKDLIYGSDEACRIFSVEPKLGIAPSLIAARLSSDAQQRIRKGVQQLVVHGTALFLEFPVCNTEQSQRVVELQAEVLLRNGKRINRLIGTVRDITVQRSTDEKIRRLAFFDSLTDLPNRVMFQEKLGISLQDALTKNAQVAILFLDLDRFKRINDSLGHNVGDQFLRTIGTRLKSLVRRTDLVATGLNETENDLVARLGGDEFTVMLTNFGTASDLAKVAQRIVAMVKKPVVISGHEVFSSASVGIAVYPQDGHDLDTLLKNADTAMFHAKSLGRDGFQYFCSEMNSATQCRLTLERELRQAIGNRELMLYYQPKLDLTSNRIVSVEALVRWQHPSGKIICPGEFIPLAEETGMIMDLGDIVMELACEQMRDWLQAGIEIDSIAINLSPLQFKRSDLVDHITQMLARTGVKPNCIQLEITEGAVMHDEEAAIHMMTELKRLGVRLAMDDFGVGYSSLSYLTRFPIDHLKIDRSFLIDLPQNQEKASIVRAIIAMAQSLNLTTVAEGVETVEQETFLRSAGCHQYQGYLLSRPIPAADFERILSKTNQPYHLESSRDVEKNTLHA